jgi:protein-disulfide isomerase
VPSRPQVVLPKSPAPTAAPPANFKRSGSPSAKVTCEIYTDYECPACARLYLEVVPQLNADYVATGKVALLHRDFPLDRHPHARMAARYANAAGTLGQYDTAVLQLFRTQMSWGLTGDLDGRLAEVLDAAAMAKVRDLVHADPDLDSSVAADLERGRADGIMHTPSIVVVSNGERRVLPSPDYAALKSVLDEFLRP